MKKYVTKKFHKKYLKLFVWAFKDIILARQPDAQLSFFQKFLINRIKNSKHGCRMLPIIPASQIEAEGGDLVPKEIFVTETPRPMGSAARQTTGIFEKITYKVFKNILAHPQSSVFIKNDAIYAPEFYLRDEVFDISDGCIVYWKTDQNMGVAFQPHTTDAPSGIMIFGTGVDNWYHWVVELLPLAHLSNFLPDQYDHLPLIVPEGVMKVKQFRDSIRAVCWKRDIISIPHRLHSFETLIVIGKPVLEPIYLHDHSPTKMEYYSMHATQISKFIDATKRSMEILPCPSDKRIFLARGNESRSYNQDELINIVKSKRFSIVFPEKLSFKEQVEVFHNAQYIIGASGAAFTNTLFCQPKTRILCWVYKNYEEFCSFSNIAKVTGSEFRSIFVEPKFTLNKKRDGYNSIYTVPVKEFERALGMMLHSEDW